MKDFFKWDEMTRDLAIVAGVVLILYIGNSITTINPETVMTGTVFQDLWIFTQGKLDPFVPTHGFFAGMEVFLTVAAIILFALVAWFGLRAGDVRREEKEKYAPIHVEEIEAKEKMVQWQVVLNHVNSESPAEWKLGILEADNMLDGILESEGYRGESLGEKLKSMDPADLRSYQDAWEAHKVRNQIAHEGAVTMDFSKKIARDTILKYEKVFKELGYI